MSEFMYNKEKYIEEYIEEGEQITFENNTDSNFGVETGIIFHKSGLYDVDISNNHVVVSKVDERKAIEEAYQKGFEAGKAQNEDGCIGCMYDDGTIEHSLCDYCCNAYSNQWRAKSKSNKIKIGEEVITSDDKKRAIVIDVDIIKETNATIVKVLKGTDTWWYKISELTKTGRYFPQIEELFKAMEEGVK